MSTTKIRAAIVGGSGYTGSELLRLLIRHPYVQLLAVTSRREAGRSICELYPQLQGALDLKFIAPEEAPLEDCDLVFFATPKGVAQEMAPALLNAGSRIIDLSADFRLRDAQLWEHWYGQPHKAPELLKEAVYGLPECLRADISGARLIANPGCYPTAILLALEPLLVCDSVIPDSFCAAAISGLSGAGRSAQIAHSLSEAGAGVTAYSAAGHRHLPEIEQRLRTLNEGAALCFVPHLAPMSRGIHATVFAETRTEDTDLQALFEKHYAGEIFVDVLPSGSHPHSAPLRGANRCHIAVHRLQGNRIVVLSALDNLVKGAAGQAVQNMNLLFSLAEDTGLQDIGLMP